MKEIIVLDGKMYVREKANNIIAKDGALYACDYEPDPNPENWRTINGAKVHINNEGYIDGGAGGKFNGNGAVPRSMFPDTDSAERRKQKKQAEARAKQQAEQHKKEVEAAREQRKQERAEASRYKQEREAYLKQERVEQKQKFDELRNSYWAEKDEKRKKAIMKELKAAAQNYEQKFGKHPDDDKIRTQKRSDEAVKRASEPLSEKLQKGIGRPQDSDKNHPYWKTPEGKAEQYFSQRMAAAEHGTFTHQDKIKSIAEAARKKALSLNSEAAGINQEIDRINRKRKYTKEDEAKVKELNKKRIKAEREATAFVNEWRKWKVENNVPEPEHFKRVVINL